MPQVQLAKVWNEGPKEWREVFKENLIVIPPGQFVEMETPEAVLFMGQFVNPKKASDQTGAGIEKRLRIEKPRPVEATEHKCMMCKKVLPDAEELALHGKHAHADSLHKDEDADAKAKGKK